MIDYIKVLIIGIIEGITEWLPVSSTGHMIIAEEFLRLNVSPEFWDMFLVVIQLGAIMAVVVLYFDKLNPWARHKDAAARTETWQIWFKTVVGVLPAAFLGFLLDDVISGVLSHWLVVAVALIFYGVVFIIIERYNKKRTPVIEDFYQLDYKTALGIGLFQVLSLVPGTSRSGSTILGGLILGTSRHVATEFSFFMSIPIMFGASLLRLVGFGFDFTANELGLLVFGMVVAFVVSVLAIKFLLAYIKRNDFTAFGWYRIILGIVVIAFFSLR